MITPIMNLLVKAYAVVCMTIKITIDLKHSKIVAKYLYNTIVISMHKI